MAKFRKKIERRNEGSCRLSEKTKKETNGYFDIVGRDGENNHAGLVKGWAIQKAAELLKKEGIHKFLSLIPEEIYRCRGKTAAAENGAWESKSFRLEAVE